MQVGIQNVLQQLSVVEASLIDAENRAVRMRQQVLQMIPPNQQHLLQAELDKLWGQAADAAAVAAATAIAEQQEVIQHLHRLLPWQAQSDDDQNGYSYI